MKTAYLIGGGLVGSLLAISLKKNGHSVHLYEKRKDPRQFTSTQGRSINLALSRRGLHAIEKICPEVLPSIYQLVVPMQGRLIHDINGALHFQPYSSQGESILSIGRAALNCLLLNKAEEVDVQLHFETTCTGKSETGLWQLQQGDAQFEIPKDSWIIASDGAFSEIRRVLSTEGKLHTTIETLEYSYKELDIHPEQARQWMAQWEVLHIWPRGTFMLIALPNTDGSLTCTLFLPTRGEGNTFESLSTEVEVLHFFERFFPDALRALPDLWEQWTAHPTSGLSTVHTHPWMHERVICIGDAAHAIVPFYGQGMNAGFEDVRLLQELIQEIGLSETTWERFYNNRKPNTDAIAYLALQNFLEMRDHVDDDRYLKIKEIEKVIEAADPSFINLYRHISFNDTPYAEALAWGKSLQNLYDHLLRTIVKGNMEENKSYIVSEYHRYRQEYKNVSPL